MPLKAINGLCAFFEPVKAASMTEIKGDSELVAQLIDALCDDLNIAKFFGIIFDKLKDIGPNEAAFVKGLLTHVLGLQWNRL